MIKTDVIRRTQNQVVVICPYCGKEHFHGKAGIPGYRVAHCGNGRQYEIRDDQTPGIVELRKILNDA